MSRENKILGGGLIALVVGAWISVGPNELDELRKLEASVEGMAIVTAEVTSCRDHVAYIQSTSSKGRTSTKAEDQAYYGYRYEVGGEAYTGGGMLKDASCPEPLGSVEVYYTPGQPSKSLMVDIHRGELRRFYFSAVCMAIASLFVLGLGLLFIFVWPDEQQGGSAKG